MTIVETGYSDPTLSEFQCIQCGLVHLFRNELTVEFPPNKFIVEYIRKKKGCFDSVRKDYEGERVIASQKREFTERSKGSSGKQFRHLKKSETKLSAS